MRRKLAASISADSKLKKEMPALASAEISTLHSWCARLIKNKFFDCGVDPEFTVLEENEERLLKTAAAEIAITELKESGDSDFAELYEAFRRNRTHKKILNAALNVYDYARSQANPENWLARSVQKTDAEYRAELYEDSDKAIEKLRAKAIALKTEHSMAGFKLDLEAIDDLLVCMANCSPCSLRTPQLTKDKQFTDFHDKFKSIKKVYSATLARREKIGLMPAADGSVKYCKSLCSLVRKLHEHYVKAKNENVKLDYGDLEHYALAVLCGEHGGDVTASYDYIFVDEYQDISPLQEAILSKFTCDMFFVGDVKQSIYGFRMCRPKFFMQKRDRYFNGEGLVVDLNANFRSGGNILRAVNEVFEKIMTKDFGGADYKEASMIAGLTLPSAVSAVFIESEEEEICVPHKIYSVKNDTSDYADKTMEKEADAVVDEILDMAADKTGSGEDAREIDFGDIAVLVRSRGAFTDLLERKLREASVPVTTVASEQSADSFRSVSALISYLRLIDNSQDDVNLSAVMLSPMFGGFSPNDLADVRKESGGAFCDAVYKAAQSNDKVARFVSQIEKFRKASFESTVAELAGRITAYYKCFNHALLMGGEREAAALDAYLEHLANQERDVLHDYIKYINVCGVPSVKVNDGGRSVRIMTIHASKGLEFECVILPQLHKQFNRSDVRAAVICDEDEGVVMQSFDFENRCIEENPRYAVCSGRLSRSLAAEELRILYVAMTRAKYRLTMFAKSRGTEEETREGDRADSYADWLYSFMQKVIKQPVKTAALDIKQLRQAPVPQAVNALKNNLLAHENALRKALKQESLVKASVSGIVHADPDGKDTPPEEIFSDDRAAKRGSAYHKFMQWVKFGAQDEWERLSKRFPEDAVYIDDAQKLQNVFKDVGEFIGGRRFVREKQFVYNASGKDIGLDGDSKTLVQGVIDLMAFNPDGTADIVDYKTGSEKNLYNPTYARQLALYRKAVEDVLKINVKNAFLYGLDCRKFIKIEL